MSNVTLSEIAQISADVFAVKIEQMAERRRGNFKHRRHALRARYATIYVAARHTPTSTVDIARYFGLELRRGRNRVKDIINAMPEVLRQDQELAAHIAEVESRVDDLHELRTQDVLSAAAPRRRP